MSKHKPKTMNPEHYRYLGWLYQGGSEAILNSLGFAHKDPEFINFMDLQEDEKLNQGNWYVGGTCDHCGSHFAWGNVYEYIPTGEKVVVGHICADKFNMTSHTQLKQREAERRAEAFRKRKKINAAEKLYRERNWLISNILDSELAKTNDFIGDLKRKLHEYGSLTERQGAAAIASTIKDFWYKGAKEEQEANQAEAEDVPEGKGLEVTGRIISTRYQDSKFAYGVTELKMLVQDDRGFRVWGTMPTSLENVGADSGSRIRFTANLEPSNDDPKFGFFKRPRKAELLS